jgi:hypothetical protein
MSKKKKKKITIEKTQRFQEEIKKPSQKYKYLSKIITAIVFILILMSLINYISILSLNCKKLLVVEKMHLKTWQMLVKGYDYVPSFIQSFREPQCFKEIAAPPSSPRFPKSDWDIIHLPTIFYFWKILCKDFKALKALYIIQGVAATFLAYIMILHITKSFMTSLVSSLFISKYLAQNHIFMLELWVVLPVFISIYLFIRGKYLSSAIFAMISFLFKETTGIVLLSGGLALIIDDFKRKSLRNETIYWVVAFLICASILIMFDSLTEGNAIRNMYFKGFHPIVFFNQYRWFNNVSLWVSISLYNFINTKGGMVDLLRGKEGLIIFGTIFCFFALWGILKNQILKRDAKIFLVLSILITPFLGMTIGDYPNPVVYVERARIAHISLPLQLVFSTLGISIIMKTFFGNYNSKS